MLPDAICGVTAWARDTLSLSGFQHEPADLVAELVDDAGSVGLVLNDSLTGHRKPRLHVPNTGFAGGEIQSGTDLCQEI